MHIGFITSHYPFKGLKSVGGIGTSIHNLAKGLVQDGHLASVFVYGQEKHDYFEEEGVHVYCIPNKNKGIFKGLRTRYTLNRYINRVIDKERIELIEAPDWTGITAFMKFKIKHLIRLNGSDAYFCFLAKRKQKFKNFFFEKMALKNADAIVSVSQFTADTTRIIFSYDKAIDIIPNSVIMPSETLTKQSSQNFQILYFGAIIRKKGVLDLAKAFNILVQDLPQATLVLVGSDTKDYKEETSTLHLFMNLLSKPAKSKVKYIPGVPHQEIHQYIKNASVVTLPSFAEALPLSWLETMSYRKPLVASNIGWSKEIITNGVNGLVIDPTNHAQYAAVLNQLLCDHNLRMRLGIKARQTIKENFSIEVIVQRNIELYQNIIHSDT